MIRIGIVGKGFVGGALVNGFKKKGVEIIKVYDPNVLPDSDITDVMDCDIVFVCVPTLMEESGAIDKSIVYEILDGLRGIRKRGVVENFKGVVAIKSTMTPLHINQAIREYSDLRIVTNPEYLTQRNADDEFLNPKWIVMGGEKEDVWIVRDFYKTLWPDVPIAVTTAEGAMMAKYMCNCWFSAKVAIMNEFYRLWHSFKFEDGKWGDVVDAFSHDVRVGPTHLDVPGPDGDFGFGGTCFPKDLNALLHVAKSRDVVCNVMEAAWETNKVVRIKRDWAK